MHSPATLQQALNHFGQDAKLDPQRRKVCAHLQACRTEAMGEALYRCSACARPQRFYLGCRDRHCPQCQARATRQWVRHQQRTVLPVAYHHLVFTLPHTLNGWVQLHPEVIYRLLFQCAWHTLQAFGAKRLDGQMGMTAILHTWGQNLGQHVHLHGLVPAGALRADGQWKTAKGNYLFPVKALSRHFRGGMVSALRQCARQGKLSRVTRPDEVDRLLDGLMGKEWVVYSKHCLTHTESVLEYLGRYAHKIAITNRRILAVDDRGVLLRYTDYRDHNRHKTLRLEGAEFVRRYLLHILPRGFTRIRHYGFLANRCRVEKLAQIRQALKCAQQPAPKTAAGDEENGMICPVCKKGRLYLIGRIPPATPGPRVGKRR